MRWSSGSVSAPTSMTGGWYVWIIDMGREEGRESVENWRWWLGEGDARPLLLYVSSAVADRANEGRAGDDGPGDAVLDGGCFCRCALPPHCDIKDKTAGEGGISPWS